jgi:hypothetical protein
MAKKKKKKKVCKPISAMDSYMKIRRDWGEVNPVTKIVPNKKKKSRAKNKVDTKKEIEDV